MIALSALNAASAQNFAASLADIFEHSPWVAQRTVPLRPFASRLRLLEAMRGCVAQAGEAEQLALIRAHPTLGSAVKSLSTLTAASAREQRRAGLAACSPQDFARLDELNRAYAGKFGMPFILAVRGHDAASIIAHFERRIGNDADDERREALRQIGLIAHFRLADVVATPASDELAEMSERLESASRHAGSLIEEWMLAADLDVSREPAGDLIGLRLSGVVQPKMLLIGVHQKLRTGKVRYGEPAGFLAGIAVLQQLRQAGVRLSFDVGVIARSGTLTDSGRRQPVGPLLAPADQRPGASFIMVHAEGDTACYAAPALERFLLQNEREFNYHGSLALYG